MARKTAVAQEEGTVSTHDVGLLKEQILDLKKQVLALTIDSTATQDVTELLQDHAQQLEALTQTISVLHSYVKMFNTFLSNSMISNNADKAAEDALTEVLNGLPN